MKGGAGFTIVETLIVLAVTMMLFLSAVLLVNGRQRNTAFNQSIRAIQGQIEQVMSDVSSGYYASDGRLQCTETGGNLILSTSGTESQGTNKDCVFMGKVLQFGVRNTDPQKYNVFTLVGARESAGTNGVFDLADASARVIARTPSDPASVPNAFDSPILQYGLTLHRAYYPSNNEIAAIGFVTNVRDLGSSDGAARVDAVVFRDTNLNRTASEGATEINESIEDNKYIVAPSGGVHMCFASGGTEQSGLISVGAGDRQNAVTLKIFNNRTCS